MGLKETLKSLTSRIKKETDKIINEKINLIMDDEGASEKIDSFKEVANYIASDQSGTLDMMSKINANASDIEKLNTDVESNTKAIASKADISYVDNVSSTAVNNLTPIINAKANASDVYNKNETHTKDEIHQMILTRVSITDFDNFKNKVDSWIRIQFDSDNTDYTITTSSGGSYSEMSAYITNAYLLVLGGDWEPDFRILRYVGYGNESGVMGYNFENSLYFLTLPYNTAKAIRYTKKPTNSALQTSIADLIATKASIEYADTKASEAREGAESYAFSQANVAYNNAKSYTDSVAATKANIIDVYNKTEIDTKETTLNQSIEDALLEAKAYADQIAAGGESNLEGYVKTATFNSTINTINTNKANVVDVYNKTEIGNLLNDKANNNNPVMNGSIELIGNTYSLKIVEHTTDSQGDGGGIRIMAKPSLNNSFYDNTNSILIRTFDGGIQIGEDYNITYYGISPLKDSHKTLGTSSYKFKELWLSGKMSDGTNEITIADLVSRYTNAQIDDKINLLLDDEGATSTLDSFKEIRDYLAANQDSADLVASVQRNTSDIAEAKTNISNATNSINTINTKISTINTTLANKADNTQLTNYQTTADAKDDYDYLNGRIDNVSAVVASNGSNINKVQTAVAGKQDALGYTPVNKAGDKVGNLEPEVDTMISLGGIKSRFSTIFAMYLNDGTKDIGIGDIVTEKPSYELSPAINKSTDTIIGNIKIGNTNNYVYAPAVPSLYEYRVFCGGTDSPQGFLTFKIPSTSASFLSTGSLPSSYLSTIASKLYSLGYISAKTSLDANGEFLDTDNETSEHIVGVYSTNGTGFYVCNNYDGYDYNFHAISVEQIEITRRQIF